jgi:hypothetical protein
MALARCLGWTSVEGTKSTSASHRSLGTHCRRSVTTRVSVGLGGFRLSGTSGEVIMSTRALKTAASRAEVTIDEYLWRLGNGQRYCYRCQEWHDASEFGPDSRRPGGKATSCLRSIRAARHAALRRELGGLPAQQPAVPRQRVPSGSSHGQWVAVVREKSADPRDGGTARYWMGPGGQHGSHTWTAALPAAARFPTAEALRDALIAAYDAPGKVPPACHLARTSSSL